MVSLVLSGIYSSSRSAASIDIAGSASCGNNGGCDGSGVGTGTARNARSGHSARRNRLKGGGGGGNVVSTSGGSSGSISGASGDGGGCYCRACSGCSGDSRGSGGRVGGKVRMR